MKKLAVVIIVCSALSGYAQQQKGDFQLQTQATYATAEGVSFGFVFLNFSSFLTDHLELGVSPIVSISDEFTSFNMTVFSNYSFLAKDAKMVPYLGAGVTFYDLTGDQPLTGFTFKGGFRYFITESVNVDIGPNLILIEDYSVFLINAGLGFLFGRRN